MFLFVNLLQSTCLVIVGFLSLFRHQLPNLDNLSNESFIASICLQPRNKCYLYPTDHDDLKIDRLRMLRNLNVGQGPVNCCITSPSLIETSAFEARGMDFANLARYPRDQIIKAFIGRLI